jgi:glycosyltransferase involved in cell wall biosynthesis
VKIAQVAPLWERVPPRLYGGTERVVAYLTDTLVEAGHDVTLFASGDSSTKARLVGIGDCALRLDPRPRDPLLNHLMLIETVLRRANDFDLIHFHIDHIHLPVTVRTGAVHVTTLHGRLDVPELDLMCRLFPRAPMISISNAQRRPLEWLNWVATVYHGLPLDLLRPQFGPGKYLAFLGRISPEKRPDRAIELAKRLGIPLRIAAKVDKPDEQYFQEQIKPLLDSSLIEFVGEITEKEKSEFLGNACALAFLIDWPEPFGLAMIEAMACGTPTIAWACGSVPEVIDHGRSGFVVHSMDEAIQAAKNISAIDRAACRRIFEQRFSAPRMAEGYLAAYKQLIDARRASMMKTGNCASPPPVLLEEPHLSR